LKEIHEQFKNQYDKLKKESDESHQRYLVLLSEKKEMENQFDNTIRSFKIAIEQKQKELEDVQAKVIPSLDHDMIRIKIINELEVPHRQALDQKQNEIEKLQDQGNHLKKEFELLQTKFNSVRFEAERDIKALKERHKVELNDLMIEIQTLHDRVDDTRDKETIRSLKREIDELRFKYLILHK
jgi:predicted  nucleic acid-binding Zn-ribbon protein